MILSEDLWNGFIFPKDSKGKIKSNLVKKWIAEVNYKSLLFNELLSHESIIELRSLGFMFAVELASEEKVNQVIHQLLEKGIIGFYFLSCRNAFRLAPPLCITEDEIKWACKEITEVLDGST